MTRSEKRTTTRDGVLVDQVRQSPVDEALRRRWRRLLAVLIAALVFLPTGRLVWHLRVDRPVDYSSPTDHFKYGSIGSEPGGSLLTTVGGLLPPYEIFRILPAICPEQSPGGYARFGFLYEPGQDLPIGVSRRQRLGFTQVGLNCAVCHTGTVRDAPASLPRVVAGMPSHQLDLQAFFRFLIDCTLDERFTADNVLGRIAGAGVELGWLERLAYRHAVIPRTRAQTLVLSRRLGLLLGDQVTAWGPGRVDTFNPYKASQFNWPLHRLPRAELTGASDLPALWNQRPREERRMQLHWDGNNDSLEERNLSAALGAGVTPVTVDHDRLRRVRDWSWELAPPPYPWAIDRARADRGREIYRTHCLDCHGDHRFRDGHVEGARLGQVERLEAVGTDRHRLDSYTEAFAANQYTLYPGGAHRFTRFRKTGGYANQPLDGIWARAPYLHNGSVPTLRDLLEPPAARPARFYRGHDVYDRVKLGFVSDVAEAGGRRFFLFDTALPGNGSTGHRYGVELPGADKDALVEYLKTF